MLDIEIFIRIVIIVLKGTRNCKENEDKHKKFFLFEKIIEQNFKRILIHIRTTRIAFYAWRSLQQWSVSFSLENSSNVQIWNILSKIEHFWVSEEIKWDCFRCVTDIEIVKVNSVCYVGSGTQYRWKLLRVLGTYAMGSKMRPRTKSINCTTSHQCPSGVNSAHRFVEDLIGFEARKL